MSASKHVRFANNEYESESDEEYSGTAYQDESMNPETMGQGQDGQAHGNSRDHKSKTKRRSKNDHQGRDFLCGCGKEYLSYPALYTHIKQKHKGETPSGTTTSQHLPGRGRGRPRKTPGDQG